MAARSPVKLQRLQFRALRREDLAEFLKYRSDPHVAFSVNICTSDLEEITKNFSSTGVTRTLLAFKAGSQCLNRKL